MAANRASDRDGYWPILSPCWMRYLMRGETRRLPRSRWPLLDSGIAAADFAREVSGSAKSLKSDGSYRKSLASRTVTSWAWSVLRFRVPGMRRTRARSAVLSTCQRWSRPTCWNICCQPRHRSPEFLSVVLGVKPGQLLEEPIYLEAVAGVDDERWLVGNCVK